MCFCCTEAFSWCVQAIRVLLGKLGVCRAKSNKIYCYSIPSFFSLEAACFKIWLTDAAKY